MSTPRRLPLGSPSLSASRHSPSVRAICLIIQAVVSPKSTDVRVCCVSGGKWAAARNAVVAVGAGAAAAYGSDKLAERKRK